MERLLNLFDNLKCSNIWITGVPEGEEQKEIENLFEQIMKENFPNLAKEIDFQDAQRVPKKLDPKRNTPRYIIKLLKIKGKERILKAARGKETVNLQRSAHKAISWFLQRNLAGEKELERSVQSHERQGPTYKISLSSKVI